LDELVRYGARQMLAGCCRDIAAYSEQPADVLDEDGHGMVVRNGHLLQRDGTGAVTVTARG